MKRALGWGVLAGVVTGIVVALLLLLVLGDDALPKDADPENLPALRVGLALLAAFVGAPVGALAGVLALRVARGSEDAEAGRVKGAAVAAAVAMLIGLLTAPIGPTLVVAMATAGALGGGLAWWALPWLVTADAAPGRSSQRPVAEPIELTGGKRLLAAAASAVLGGILLSNVLLAVVRIVTPLERSDLEPVAPVVLIVLGLLLGWSTWRRTGPRTEA